MESLYVYRYRLHSTAGDDLGLLEYAAPNLEPGDTVFLADGTEALVTARVETVKDPLAALLEIAPTTPPNAEPVSRG